MMGSSTAAAAAAASGYRRRSTVADLHFGPNMTPMVDVVMVILVFFMASTALLGPEWFLKAAIGEDETESAETTSQQFDVPAARFSVTLVARDGQTLATGFGTVDATLTDFEPVIRAAAEDLLGSEAQDSEPIIMIEPDASVPYRDVVRILDTCTGAGFSRAGLR